MVTQEKLHQAYRVGIELAVKTAGLEKSALIPELLSKATSLGSKVGIGGGRTLTDWASANPALARMAAGAAIGGVGGGMTDVGAGRGAMAGALGGALYGPASQWGRQAFTKNMAERLAATKQLEKAKRFEAQKGILHQFGGPKSELRQQLTNQAGLAGGLGAAGLGGGAALLATRPEEPKHWWSGML